MLSASTWSQPTGDIWTQTFKAIDFAATSRASFRLACRPENPLSAVPQYRQLCPKLEVIPDSVIETAGLPYLKQYLTEAVALQAITFWSSSRGKTLSKKIIREIETGEYNQLNAEDVKVLNIANQSEYGRALSSFASDRAQGTAVAQAMLAYVPNPSFKRDWLKPAP